MLCSLRHNMALVPAHDIWPFPVWEREPLFLFLFYKNVSPCQRMTIQQLLCTEHSLKKAFMLHFLKLNKMSFTAVKGVCFWELLYK